ncbi:G2-specific serine/threonine protein kinase [Vermiconidia calcicola]|uniref:G2-specific serine/threonine protein kinase n=1 Tax=Vermiconidia calcicola TaxID=1690605 RepID=A0ACC3MLF5_9PEZI|nr:G2-specific serine/threonine protein kinase [Vermiconidia calcicola]
MAEKEDEKYEVLEKIGQGSFGIIRKVRIKGSSQILCRKEISYSRMSEKERNQLHAELRILESLRHPNIVQYCHREHLKSSHDLHLYMEYCGNGDLGGYVKKLKERNQYADEEFVWSIFAQLVSALYRCHYGEDPPKVGEEGKVRNGKAMAGYQTKEGYRMILHRDLKPENVFLGNNNSVKLGDFGLSKIIASHDFASTYVGTPFYMSPEICAAERYSHHSDIWSLGCIIYELASRCVPFDARNHVELIMKIKAGKIKPLPAQYSRELSDTIAWCLKVDSRSRPDTAQLLNIVNIKLARTKLLQLEQTKDVQQQLSQAQKQIQELQAEVQKLREHGKKVEMEWHARATLAIDQRVQEQVEAKKAELLKQFETAVDQRAEQKLNSHLASLPASHGLSAGDSTHVRSSTPPPGKVASFATTASTTNDIDHSSFIEGLDDSALETDMTSLSVQDEPEDEASPLAQRTKPFKKQPRKPLGRAKTYANCNLNAATADPSPMDVHMADPSPMPPHVAPMSIKGLSLSPRKNGQDRLSGGAALRRNIFAKDTNLRPQVQGESNGRQAFADDDDSDGLDDEADVLHDVPDSPSRPTSGLSDHTAGGDPFRAFDVRPAQPKLVPRPSLGRQKTMPVSMQPRNQAPRTNFFGARAPKSPEKEKENRPPPISHARTNSAVPVVSASPKRNNIPPPQDPKALTPSRKAPPPPPAASNIFSKEGLNLARQAIQKNNMPPPPSPSKLQGRTLVQLQQARSQPSLLPPESDDEETVATVMGGPKLMPPSPAKWDPMKDGEEMPSPFLAKKVGRAMVR